MNKSYNRQVLSKKCKYKVEDKKQKIYLILTLTMIMSLTSMFFSLQLFCLTIFRLMLRWQQP